MLDVSPITTATEYQSSGGVVYARVENQAGCFSIATVALSVTTTTITLQIDPISICDDTPIDGFTSFDLSSITDTFSAQLPTDATVVYYASISDASMQVNSLNSPYINTSQNDQTIFVRVASDSECVAIGSVDLEVLSTPELAENEIQIYCLNNFPNTVQIDSGVLGNANGFSYSWQFGGTTLDATTSFLNINEVGTYTVTVTAPSGCTATRVITVQPSNTATIDEIIVEDGIQNNTITIDVSGEGDYEYALDSIFGPFVESPVFTNVSSGFHTVYVRDRNGCGVVSEEAAVIGFPKFFTPNGDGVHDTWKVDGASNTLNPTIQFVIFDRFGKVLLSRRRMGNGWNGMYNGTLMPSNGYWYLVTLADGRTFRGPFSLIRRGR